MAMRQTWVFKGVVKDVTIVGTGGNRRWAIGQRHKERRCQGVAGSGRVWQGSSR